MPPWKLKLDREDFLANYWQRKPLLIRDAIRDFQVPLDANELAGLAMEECVESRIIEHRQQQWDLFHGPFDAGDFQREAPWTLLVQAVDHYVPEVSALRQLVDFIPLWRVDDVMVSYAVDGGSVGPHYDNYDVFLLQGEGQRTWKLGQHCDGNSALLPHDQLRILDEFSTSEEYTLESGDILYVPPGVAHWGIARGECTTFSIGFRAPRIDDLVSRAVDGFLDRSEGQDFYRDPPLGTKLSPGEIRREDLDSARAQLLAALQSDTDGVWFGELLTEPKYDAPEVNPPSASLVESLESDADLLLQPDAKIAWQADGERILVFANGDCLPHDGRVKSTVITLCDNWRLSCLELTEALECEECAILLGQLYERGCVEFDR